MSNPSTAIKDFRAAISALEKKRNSRIFSVIHNGQGHHICGPEFWTTFANREQFRGISTLEILIHSPGGHANVAYQLARFFKGHCKRLNALIPMQAKSAATVLSLNADTIFMGEFAELGPIDTQLKDELEKGKHYFSPLDEFKSVEYLREYSSDILDYLSFVLENRGMSVKQALHEAIPGVTGIMAPLYSHIDPSRLGSYRRLIAEAEEYAKRLLAPRFGEHAAEVVERLVWDYPTHDFIIDVEEAKEIGLPVQRLPRAEERTLTRALVGLMEYDLSYAGFVSQTQKQSVRTAHGKKRSKRARKMPTIVAPKSAVGA